MQDRTTKSDWKYPLSLPVEMHARVDDVQAALREHVEVRIPAAVLFRIGALVVLQTLEDRLPDEVGDEGWSELRQSVQNLGDRDAQSLFEDWLSRRLIAELRRSQGGSDSQAEPARPAKRARPRRKTDSS